VNGLNETPAVDSAEIAIAGESDLTAAPSVETSLLNSAPEIAPSPEVFERIEKHRNYRGPVRTECDDQTWDALRAAVKSLLSHVSHSAEYELPIWIAEGLLSLQKSRPVEQLLLEFADATDSEQVCDWWVAHKDTAPNTDFRAVFNTAFAFGWRAMSDPPPVPASQSRFAPVVPNLTAPRPKWIVKHILPEKALAVIYGRWGTGKSSLAIELGVHVARGIPWHGRKVKQGAVVYIASENAHGFRMRVEALLREQGVTLDDLCGRFLEITGRPHLLRPDQVQELINELKMLGPISLIVVDTLARAAAGADENAAKEMGVAVENCQSIMNATGATVALVHHEGKDSARGMRGSSALPAAADTEIILERPDDEKNFRTARLGKQRDGADYCALFDFELKVVELGVDEDGENITSTVVHEVTPPESAMTVIELPNSPVRRAIRGVLGDAQHPMPFEELIGAAINRLAPPDPGERDRRRNRVRQAYERMLGDNELHADAQQMVTLLNPAIPFAPVPNSDLTGGAQS
jgi:hypothetical protein